MACKYKRIIIDQPIKSPGIIPPKKSRPTEILFIPPKRTMGMLGGMIGPMVADAAVIAALKGRG